MYMAAAAKRATGPIAKLEAAPEVAIVEVELAEDLDELEEELADELEEVEVVVVEPLVLLVKFSMVVLPVVVELDRMMLV
jgi:hypothetical protein